MDKHELGISKDLREDNAEHAAVLKPLDDRLLGLMMQKFLRPLASCLKWGRLSVSGMFHVTVITPSAMLSCVEGNQL